jgi:hypothetical protein
MARVAMEEAQCALQVEPQDTELPRTTPELEAAAIRF